MTTVVDQPALWDLEPEPAPARPPLPVKERRVQPPTHTPRPRRSKELQAEECDPTCLTCGKPEGRGLCTPRCSVACTHTRQPDKVEICLVQMHVTAVLVSGARTLRGSASHAVVLCPWCGDVHRHAPAYGVIYRVAPCGPPYLVHLARPRIGATA